MLNSKKLSLTLQAKAINISCYTINRVYLRPGTIKTPYEIWEGIFEEDEIINLIKKAKNQMLNDNIIPNFATPIVQDVTIDESGIDAGTSSTTETETSTFDIIDPIKRDPPTRIQKNHLIENILVNLLKTREQEIGRD